MTRESANLLMILQRLPARQMAAVRVMSRQSPKFLS
jgi:hypothetical protein